MLARTLIIIAYLLATLLTPAQASVCSEMAVGDGYVYMGEISRRSPVVSDSSGHINDQSTCPSNIDRNDCNDMCTTVYAPSSLNIYSTPQLATLIRLPDSIVPPNTTSQILAAHSTRQLRPPIS